MRIAWKRARMDTGRHTGRRGYRNILGLASKSLRRTRRTLQCASLLINANPHLQRDMKSRRFPAGSVGRHGQCRKSSLLHHAARIPGFALAG
jgi:hypothetical protein